MLQWTTLTLLLIGCAPVTPPQHTVASSPPRPPRPPAIAVSSSLRLPGDVQPKEELLELRVDPHRERFSGTASLLVHLDVPRRVIYLHGKGLAVGRVTVTPQEGGDVAAAWSQVDESGMAALILPQPLQPGMARIRIEFAAPFGSTLRGLHRVKQSGLTYAFTQFEPIAARESFPCFDEPSYKIPFTLTLIVPKDMEAVANAREQARVDDGKSWRVHFAPTPPIPSYLVAFAVGPLDIVAAPDLPPNSVRARPLQLRGIAARGRGKEMAYALAHAGELLALLEEYFGSEYPYDKLDLLAVPDKQGAMENPGAATFSESLLFVDESTASVAQRRRFAGVVAHEFAHFWLGDLVTMRWWDDIWLSEAFATWMGHKIVDRWNPNMNAQVDLLAGVQRAMDADSLASARAVRQPIESTHDIENAFDAITYQKGAAVLAMFERWLGHEAFRQGVRRYLEQHRFGSAGTDDFIAAISATVGRDLTQPLRTFLDQPGVPWIEARTICDGAAHVHVRQSRYLPLGSSGESQRTWQVPVCARFGVGKEVREVCTLVSESEGELPLGATCPDWVFPNAEGAGYFRVGLAATDLARLRRSNLRTLSTRERIAYVSNMRAAYDRGATSFAAAFESTLPLVGDAEPEIAGAALHFLQQAREWLYDDPMRSIIEAYLRKIYGGLGQKLGFQPAPDESPQRMRLRVGVIEALASIGRDPLVRNKLWALALDYLGHGADGAIHADAVDPNVITAALAVAGEQAKADLWEAMRAQLHRSEDETLRERLLWALAQTQNPVLAARALSLTLDATLRTSEALTPLWAQMAQPQTRDVAWAFIKAHFVELMRRVGDDMGAWQLLAMAEHFCDEDHLADVERLFRPRARSLVGGPRLLANALEEIRLCIARRRAHAKGAWEFFADTRSADEAP